MEGRKFQSQVLQTPFRRVPIQKEAPHAYHLGISSADLQTEIQALDTPCEYFETFDEIENYLLENIAPGDLLITMGAGDIVKVGENLLGQ